MTQREEHRSLYLSYLEYCNKHDLDRMASFYTSTIKVNDVPMNPVAVAAQFAPPCFPCYAYRQAYIGYNKVRTGPKGEIIGWHERPTIFTARFFLLKVPAFS